MARLSLTLLGPLDIRLDGRPIAALAYDKVWALLAYLAIEAERPHRRDALIGLLWPDQAERAARTNLRQALSQLRQALGDHMVEPPFLLIERETVQFNCASDHDLDVCVFEALLAGCDAHPHRRLDTCTACALRLGEAATLYRGGFLEEFAPDGAAAFEEWALLKREELHHRACQALARLAAYHERCGDYEQVRRYVRRWLQLEPWEEAAHRQAMRAFAAAGQRSAAQRQYDTCRKLLAKELGVEPEAETSALYEHIRRGEALAYIRPPATNLAEHMLPGMFVGREAELAAIAERLGRRDCRLLTLVGPGGIGKTRLALQAAHGHLASFPDGVYFVPLAPLSSAEFLLPAIANALSFLFQGSQEPQTQLLAYLREKEMLLVLDNFEHLGAGAGLLVDILRGAPNVTLLVTSREPLNLRAEWLLDIQGMAFPDSAAAGDIEAYSAVQLFLQVASRLQASATPPTEMLASAVRICQLVEGMPLAIELAAAWVRVRSGAAIVRAIERGLDDLATTMHDVPERHRSIRAVFDYSWRRLSDHERRTLAAISVFRGGFDPQAAIEVADAPEPMLTSLVNKSLLRRGPDGRYDLHELIRHYAGEKLPEIGDTVNVRDRHLRYFLMLAERVEAQLCGAEQVDWIERLEAERDNLRAALTWSTTEADRVELGLRLAGALGQFWLFRGYLGEGRKWLTVVLEQTESLGPALARAKAFAAEGILAWDQRDYGAAHAQIEKSIAVSQETGDKWQLAYALTHVGAVDWSQGNYTAACSSIENGLALFRALGDDWGVAISLGTLARAMRDQKRYDQAALLFAEALALFRALGNRWGIAQILNGMAVMDRALGNDDQAQARFEEALALRRALKDKGGIARSLTNLGSIALRQGDYGRAAALFEEHLALVRELGDISSSAKALANLGELARLGGNHRQATIFYAESLALFRELGNWLSMKGCLTGLAEVATMVGQQKRAARLFGAVEALFETVSANMCLVALCRRLRAACADPTQLDEAAIAAAWADGRAMSLDQAISYALGKDE